MTKQEQIEEMAKERNEIRDIMKLLDKCVSLNPMYKSEVASVLYGNNYRKLPENAVVLTKEEYIDLSRNYVTEQIEQARKKTAKEILSKLNALMEQYHYKSTAWRNCANFIKERYGLEAEE